MTSSPSNSATARVFANLVWPLEKRFSWKVSDDQADETKLDMVAAFADATPEELQAMASTIRLTRKFTTMPTVGDMRAVLDGIREARVASERKTKAAASALPATHETFASKRAADLADARDWARDWLRRSEMGQRALAEGWARGLYGLVWQIRSNRARRGDWSEDIAIDDLATQETTGVDVLRDISSRRARNVALERALILKEPI